MMPARVSSTQIGAKLTSAELWSWRGQYFTSSNTERLTYQPANVTQKAEKIGSRGDGVNAFYCKFSAAPISQPPPQDFH